MTPPDAIPDLWRLRLAVAAHKAARAGFGIVTESGFEAIPGCENAAADFIHEYLFPDDEVPS